MTFIAALAFAPMAAAQDAAPPASAEAIAEARARADRLIADANAVGVFVNSTKDDGLARVTHLPSGMTCTFGGAPQDRISIFPSTAAGVPHGEDVGCVSFDAALTIDMTLYATRYRPLPSEAAVLADARRAITSRWPDAQPYTGGLPMMTLEGRSPTLSAAYKIRINEAEKLTMALVTHRDGWGFKARATGPYDQATGVALYAGVLLEGALLDRED
ncbi:MAG: hypothetical protein REJ23_06790 [Brevundimonas sp.]|nr:hypothetical protein [Brevundimonas sp.]